MSEPRRATLPVSGAELPILEIEGRPGGPALVVVPSIFGAGDDLAEQMVELAGAAGYAAAMDPFFRTAAGVIAYDRFGEALERMNATDLAQSYEDFGALIEHARGRGNGRVVGLGICFGGPFTFMAAAAGALDGVVTWHGSRLPGYAEAAARAEACAFRLHFGADDPVVPADAIAAIRVAFADHPDVEIAVHDGANHGFSHRASPRHQPRAEAAALEAARALLVQLGDGP